MSGLVCRGLQIVPIIMETLPNQLLENGAHSASIQGVLLKELLDGTLERALVRFPEQGSRDVEEQDRVLRRSNAFPVGFLLNLLAQRRG